MPPDEVQDSAPPRGNNCTMDVQESAPRRGQQMPTSNKENSYTYHNYNDKNNRVYNSKKAKKLENYTYNEEEYL